MIFSKAARQFAITLLAIATFITVASADWKLGDHELNSYRDVKPLPLLDSTRPKTLMQSPELLGKRIGVICQGQAEPTRGLQVNTFVLSYDASLPDGERLVVEVNGKVVKTPRIYDWQLIPVVNFAHDIDEAGKPRVSIVTLGGDVTGKEQPKVALVCNLHPAFENTQVGFLLTLLDYGIGNLDVAGMLPTKDGVPLVDKSHGLPEIDKAKSEKAAKFIGGLLKKEVASNYLIYDKEAFGFKVADDNLTFTGKLYCFFWSVGIKFDDAREEATEYVKEAKVIGKEFNGALETWRDLNPPVFDNAMTVYNFTNLFRYTRDKNPDGWKKFVATVRKVKIEEIKTPVVYRSPLRQLILEVDGVMTSLADDIKGLPVRKQRAAVRDLLAVQDKFGEALQGEPNGKKLVAVATALREGRKALDGLKGAERVDKGVELLKQASGALKD